MLCPLSIAPPQHFRVVGVDLVNDERYIVGDYRDKAKALEKMYAHNAKRRKKAWCRDDIYFVYDDEGCSIG